MNGCMLLALCFDKGLTLKTSTIETFYSGQFTLSTHLIKLNYFVTPPLTEHYSFYINLPFYEMVMSTPKIIMHIKFCVG